MSTVFEPQISEGYPVDGRVFEPPQQRRDNEEPRYVTFLGNLTIPEAIQDCPWMKFGGLQITNPCLRFVKHFLLKGRITPVLKDTHNWVTVDYWEKATAKDASYFLRQVPKGYIPPDRDEFGNRSPIPPMMGKIAFPGDQMDAIVNGPAARLRGVRRGVVELKTLKGQPYNPEPLEDGVVQDAAIWRIQKTILPSYPLLPILLDDIERMLDAATIHTSLRSVTDEMAASLNQFRDYARSTIEQTHYNMRESGVKSESGYIPRYTELDFVLLEQLGMARQDIAIRREASSPSIDPELREMFKQFIQLSVEEKAAIAAERNAQSKDAPAINETTMMAQPPAGDAGQPGQEGTSGTSGASGQVTNATSEGQEQINVAMADTEPEFKCGGCGQEAKSLAGLKAHERACEKAQNGE